MKIGYVLKDEKTGVHNPPFFLPSVADLVRSLEQVVRAQPDSMLAQYPQDFSIWEIGTWDEKSGEMSLHQNKDYQFHMTNIVRKEVPHGGAEG